MTRAMKAPAVDALSLIRRLRGHEKAWCHFANLFRAGCKVATTPGRAVDKAANRAYGVVYGIEEAFERETGRYPMRAEIGDDIPTASAAGLIAFGDRGRRSGRVRAWTPEEQAALLAYAAEGEALLGEVDVLAPRFSAGRRASLRKLRAAYRHVRKTAAVAPTNTEEIGR